MICPKCNSEFVEGVTTCSDCEISLVDFIPDSNHNVQNPLDDVHFISVYNPINSQEVSLIKMIMEREEIPYYIKNDRLHGAVLFSIQGPGKMELFVPEEYARRVVDLLKVELNHE